MLGGTLTIALAFLLSTSVSAAEPANSETVYYQAEFKTSSLGNYKMSINSFETPSHEVLPIISKDYFSNTLKEFTTEVDNTEPSARYDTKSVSKVDVVFAIGDTKQSEQLQNFIPTFTTQLESAGNFIDARVEQVKTSTIDMSAFGAKEIFETWLKLPVDNNANTDEIAGRKNPWRLNEAKGAIYTYKAKSIGRCLTAVLDPKGFDTTDFTMSYTAYGDGECMLNNGNLARNAAGQSVSTPDGVRYWGGHSYGSWFRITEEPNNTYSAYIFVAKGNGWRRESIGTWDGITCTLGKVTNVDKDMLNKMYNGYHFYPMCGGSAPSTVGQYGVDVPLYDWWGGSGFPQIMPVGGTYKAAESSLTVLSNKTFKGFPDNFNFEIICKGNNIVVKHGGKEIINVTDNDKPLLSGSYGVWSGSSPDVYFTDFKITKGEKKSLGDAISNVQWRDGSARVIIHAAETVPDDMKDEQSNDYAYTLSKVLNTNAYLINLGTSINEKQLTDFGKKLTTANGETKAVYYDSRSPDVVSAMIKSKDYIVELCRTLSKSVSWVLVNEEVIWNTTYNDTEKDLPLNYGGNKDDINISNTWGMALTNYYKEDKLFAEKWRYRHTLHFDNSTIIEPWSDTWIEDPVRIFENPGKFRINYKRRDNPFYTNTSLSSPFDSYRYFSKDYDRREILE